MGFVLSSTEKKGDSVLLVSTLIAALAAALCCQAQSPPSQDADKAKQIDQAVTRGRKLESQSNLSAEQKELHLRAGELINRLRQAPAGSYKLERLAAAIKALHDASIRIGLASNANQAASVPVAKDDVKWNLDRAYFRTAQIDFFARRVKETATEPYVQMAQRLYQMAAAAYDSGHYYRADRLALASSTVVHCIEALAQAELKTGERPARADSRE
jgi:hypothetical protein